MKNLMKMWPILVVMCTVLVATGGQLFAIDTMDKRLSIIEKQELNTEIKVIKTELKNINKSLTEMRSDRKEQQKLILEIYKAVK